MCYRHLNKLIIRTWHLFCGVFLLITGFVCSRKCLSYWPEDGRLYVALGKIMIKQSKTSQAREIYEKGCQATQGENAFIWQVSVQFCFCMWWVMKGLLKYRGLSYWALRNYPDRIRQHILTQNLKTLSISVYELSHVYPTQHPFFHPIQCKTLTHTWHTDNLILCTRIRKYLWDCLGGYDISIRCC